MDLLRSVIDELKQIKVVNMRNRELVLDLLQSVVEIITYGDKHDPSILECFMDRQVVAEFVRMLDISENSRVEAPLLQYLSIMIQNMDNEHAICKTIFRPINSVMHEILCYAEMLSNMAHRIQMVCWYFYIIYWYVLGFILTIVSAMVILIALFCIRMNLMGRLGPILYVFSKDAVVSFPLYTEALRFAHHEEKMIQTAVRTIALNIYNVVGGRSMINNVAGVILYHVLNLNARTLSEGNASDSSALRSHNVSQENDQDLDPMDILPRGHVLFV
ncbi:hypothetical protein Ahy_A07g036925 [Arachis hypogaea]|uniref:FPL domain-containing protein n=1 Tax=Arachis hypogaea TaxID=3818 RepID=A0A445CHE0_ARAHY|nr:hypothetical protein Ahy_A07g036925 [Arachis hypogaea]